MHIDLLLAEINRVVPGVKVMIKQDSALMKVVNFIVRPFCPAFMTRYITTIGNTIYWPEKLPSTETDMVVIAHEFVHLYDSKKRPILYEIAYLFPQVLALLALLAFVSKWAFLFLLFLLPVPAYFRTKIELRGYIMSMAFKYWRYGNTSFDTYIKQFTGATYYFMCPFSKYINGKFEEALEAVVSGDILSSPTSDNEPYRAVYVFLRDNNLVCEIARGNSETQYQR